MVAFVLVKEKQKKIWEKISEDFFKKNIMALLVFTDPEVFYKQIGLSPWGLLDFVLIDSTTYDSECENPYEKVLSYHTKTACVVYNDPFVTPENAVDLWYSRAVKYYGNEIDEVRLCECKKTWEKLSEVIFSKENKKFFPAICDVPEYSTLPFEFNPQELYLRKLISPLQYRLLNYLNERKNTDVLEVAICYELWQEFSKKRINHLFNLVYHCRKVLKEEYGNAIRITHEFKGFYALVID